MDTNARTKTGTLYGTLFTNYDEERFEESVALFEKRHRLWNIDTAWFCGKTCLDVGCGGGRYLVALARLGVKHAYGIDISEKGVAAANARLKARKLANASAQIASALSIPFPEKTFEYVVSTGVIHHTGDTKKAFDEIVRVLKPGGKLFLAVYGKGGLKWLTNDLFRNTICKIVPFKTMNALWKAVGVPANKRYNMLDNMYVPYLSRHTEKEIRTWLTEAGFTNISRLPTERYDHKTLRSRIVHGEGWLQFYADKL